MNPHHRAGQKNTQGLTAWQLAERNGHEDLAALLKVETGPFPHPKAFLPPHPQDLLDRPPTPTERRCVEVVYVFGGREGERVLGVSVFVSVWKE